MTPPDNRPALSPRPWNWLVTIVGALLAAALLAAAIFVQPPARAAADAAAQSAATSSFEGEEAEGEEEEWEDGEEGEFEDEEEDEEDGEFGSKGALLLPPDCLLHSAEAEVTSSAAHNLVQLTIHYTANTPTTVGVDYWLKGGKGSLHFNGSRSHFAERGTFRDSEHLSDRAMEKVEAARAFVVELDIPAAPSFCARYSTQRLTVKHGASNRATWSRAG